MSSVSECWGATPEEQARAYPCDALASDDWVALYRAVSVDARPATVFRWLCQMKKAPYSYDWLDNLGRKSPTTLTPGLEELEIGQRVMTIFTIVSFERDAHLTLELAPPLSMLSPTALSYVVSPDGDGTRLAVKIVAPPPMTMARRAAWRSLAWGDLLMMRKQLLTLKRLAELQEREARPGSP